MKTLLTLALALVFGPFAAKANVQTVDYAPATVFAVEGFDDNDNAQLVLDGMYPNTCYKSGEATVQVDRANKRIDITDRALYYSGSICLYMMVNYSKSLNLGVLPEGDYEIFVNVAGAAPAKAGVLPVKKATTTGADDFLYAPVDEVSMDSDSGTPIVKLAGTFTKSCLKVKEVKVSVGANYVVMQPVAETDGTACQDGSFAFSESVKLTNAPKGRFLLHVRSLNGQAVNRVLEL